jgi:THO complex subunit 3
MVRVWNPEKPNIRQSTELRGHTSSVERVAFHPLREDQLATCSRDGTVKFWDVRTKACVHTVALGGDLTYLTWSRDGEDLLVGSIVWTLITVGCELELLS